jgi:RNA polymerase sigma-70 factor (ECF subfamily)
VRGKIAAVAAVHPSAKAQQADSSPATLGEVLYADQSRPRIPEEDWARLVEAVAAGDQVALHRLYERAHRVVFTLAMRITGSRETAEEVTLDVFHDVWRRSSRYDARNGTVLGWVMNQARSRAIDRVRFEQRKKRAEPDYGDPAMQNEPQNGHDLLVVKEENRAVQTALAVLTPDEKRAIEAAFFSELTHAEVATELKQPLGTVKTRIRSGLHKLKQALAAGKKE